MAIEDLLSIVPTPAAPIEAENDGMWEHTQQAIGTRLPKDYLEFGLHYGSGALCGYIGVINPLSPRYEASTRYLLQKSRDVRSFRHHPYEIYPEQSGLLPWGSDDNGNLLHWLTDGDVDDWIVVVESHEGDFEQFELSMTSFLAKALANIIRPKHIWNRPFSQDDLIFTPQT